MTQSENADFPSQVATQVGQLVKTARSESGLSAQKLADECTRLGVQMTRNMVASIENKRRSSVSVPEVLAISTVLRIPPITLLFPLTRSPFDICHGQPGAELSAINTFDWFTGSRESYTFGDFDKGVKADRAAGNQWEQMIFLTLLQKDRKAIAQDLRTIGNKVAGQESGLMSSIGVDVILHGLTRNIISISENYRMLNKGGADLPELATLDPLPMVEDYLALIAPEVEPSGVERIEHIRSILSTGRES